MPIGADGPPPPFVPAIGPFKTRTERWRPAPAPAVGKITPQTVAPEGLYHTLPVANDMRIYQTQPAASPASGARTAYGARGTSESAEQQWRPPTTHKSVPVQGGVATALVMSAAAVSPRHVQQMSTKMTARSHASIAGLEVEPEDSPLSKRVPASIAGLQVVQEEVGSASNTLTEQLKQAKDLFDQDLIDAEQYRDWQSEILSKLKGDSGPARSTDTARDELAKKDAKIKELEGRVARLDRKLASEVERTEVLTRQLAEEKRKATFCDLCVNKEGA